MKKYSRALYSLLFCALTAAMLYGAANLLRDRETTLASFYSEEKGSIDMAIVGSSHVNSGIIPNLFWEECNISACNVYSWAQPMWTAYHYIVEALSEQDLDIVLLDLYGMTYGNSYIMPQEIDRVNYETSFNIDMNLNYLSLIHTAENVGLDLRPYEDFLNLPRYHTRWKKLNQRMFTYNPHDSKDFLKGYGISYTAQAQTQEAFSVSESVEPYEFCVEYLDKIVQLCEKEQVQLVFTMVPYIYNETEAGIDLWIEDYAAQHGIPYISYIGKDASALKLDYATDFQDNGHLNYYGAKKTTLDLAGRLKEMFPNYQKEQNPHRDQIDEDYAKYQRVVTSNQIMVENDLARYLEMALADENYILYLVNSDSPVTDTVQAVLQQHGIAVEDDRTFCAVLSAEQNSVNQWQLSAQLFDKQGTVEFEAQSGNAQIYLNGVPVVSVDSSFKAVLYDKILERPLETIAFDQETGKLSHKEFSSDIIGLFKK